MKFQRLKFDQYLQLPEKPGVYKFFNKNDQLLYVGKAKSLKKRVSSYFTKKKHENKKSHLLVNGIFELEFITVDTEFDALLLESNLIKEYQPKYNVLLRDDKSYPSILVTNERFSRIYATRRIDPNKGEYFGPYSSVSSMNNMIDMIRKLYNIRTCKYNLSPNNIKNKKFKVCLEYHIQNCMGPCEGLQSETDYLNDIEDAKKILKGKASLVVKSFKEKMRGAAAHMNYEEAQKYKEKIELLDNYQSKSLIVNPKLPALDVFTIIPSTEGSHYINFLKVNHGSIINSVTVEAKSKINENQLDLLQYGIFELRRKYKSDSHLILTNIQIDSWNEVEIIVPQIGDKKKLVELSLKNAYIYKKENLLKHTKTYVDHSLNALMKDLQLKDLPFHIECFDNSNIQGAYPVAAMVCFKNGKPSKKEYRKYLIKTVVGPDDFSSMKEIIYRRYRHLTEIQGKLPQLIIIDGGKGQLSAACEALHQLNIYGKIPIIGIAKRLEEIYFPEDSIPIYLNKKSLSLKLIQKIRDETHRFAITFHRHIRTKNSVKSKLDTIKGIGPITKQKLLLKFKSVSRIKKIEKKKLVQLIGESKTKILLQALENVMIN